MTEQANGNPQGVHRARGLVALIATAGAVALAATLALASAADAAVQWNDGQQTTSTLYNSCLGIEESGALAYAGFKADPSHLPQAGQVFYGHAVFGAATQVGGGGCGGGDQYGELDLVLPPGVSLAVTGSHPIYCFYEDSGQPEVRNSTCPTHTVGGTYGPQLPAGDGGGPWEMPPGRLLEVQFPLVSTRQLKGPAGGNCPEDLSDLQTERQNDCLITALHIADGDTDPWLVPDEYLFLDPATRTGAAPNTLIAQAKLSSATHKAVFKFRATGRATRFECELSRGHHNAGFTTCSSPKTYKHLKHGNYVFEVRAVGPGGKDRSPAKHAFAIR
jgi:hypothetical protein